MSVKYPHRLNFCQGNLLWVLGIKEGTEGGLSWTIAYLHEHLNLRYRSFPEQRSVFRIKEMENVLKLFAYTSKCFYTG